MSQDAKVTSISKAEVKRLMAKEHNRAYEAGELNKPVDLRQSVREVVEVVNKSLGFNEVKS